MNVDVQEKRPHSNREQEIDETFKTLYLSLSADQVYYRLSLFRYQTLLFVGKNSSLDKNQ